MEENPYIDQMREFMYLAEGLDPVPEPAQDVEVEPIVENIRSPILADLENMVSRMRALMESSGNGDYDEGFDAASERWAEVLENLIRRHDALLQGRKVSICEGMHQIADHITTPDAGLMFEMAGLRSAKTGLPFYVWVSPRGGSKHDVRIKVSPSHRYQPDQEAIIALRPDIRVLHGTINKTSLDLVTKWAGVNMEAILAFWNEDIDTDDLNALLKKI